MVFYGYVLLGFLVGVLTALVWTAALGERRSAGRPRRRHEVPSPLGHLTLFSPRPDSDELRQGEPALRRAA